VGKLRKVMFGKRKEIQGRQITISGGNIQNNSI
jgi:hypothetical protein